MVIKCQSSVPISKLLNNCQWLLGILKIPFTFAVVINGNSRRRDLSPQKGNDQESVARYNPHALAALGQF